MTQFERIKAMSIDEMAEAFGKDNYCQICILRDGQTCNNTSCKQGIKQYLESEVEEE